MQVLIYVNQPLKENDLAIFGFSWKCRPKKSGGFIWVFYRLQ